MSVDQVLFRNSPPRGHSYGYKLHALCGISGVTHFYNMTAANVHDLHYLNHLMMIRNYAKKPEGLFTRMAAKVAAFTILQYVNLTNHKPSDK